MVTKKKSKKSFVELTLWGVVLSYPDLHEPKPYKGKTYYRTDALLDKEDPQVAALKAAIKSVKTDKWGSDSSEWPKAKKPLLQDGDEREDQTGYAGKFFITASTQTPISVVDMKAKAFNPQMVKGGMFANVAIRISAWEYDGDEGVSIYLQGVQIDTSKASLNFGGGKSVKQMFNRDGDELSEDDGDSSDDADSEEIEDEDEDDKPRSKKKPAQVEDEEDDKPKKKAKPARNFDDSDDD